MGIQDFLSQDFGLDTGEEVSLAQRYLRLLKALALLSSVLGDGLAERDLRAYTFTGIGFGTACCSTSSELRTVFRLSLFYVITVQIIDITGAWHGTCWDVDAATEFVRYPLSQLKHLTPSR